MKESQKKYINLMKESQKNAFKKYYEKNIAHLAVHLALRAFP